MNILLWILQILLGLLFLFSGVSKFLIPADEMAKNIPPYLSLNFIYFIGVCEALGGVGLILPWATGIMRWLTPLAAGLLVIIMIGAVAVSPKDAKLLIPAVTGVLCTFVAWSRWNNLRSLNN
jgi:uncharacterized membrane protein